MKKITAVIAVLFIKLLQLNKEFKFSFKFFQSHSTVVRELALYTAKLDLIHSTLNIFWSHNLVSS